MTRPVLIALVMVLISAGWCLLIVSPPLLHGLDSHGIETLVRLGLSPICHQMPSRSLHVAGLPMGVCARCFGIYAGFFAGTIVAFLVAIARRRLPTAPGRLILVVSALPTCIQWSLATAGLVSDSAMARTVTSSFFGLVIAFLILPAIDSLHATRKAGRTPMGGRLDAAETT